MGWEVLGLGEIIVDKEYTQDILNLLIGNKSKIINKLKNKRNTFYDVNGKDGFITFAMSSNKVLNYDNLDMIKDYCKKNKISIEISVNEFVESDGGGYYHNSEDDDL